MGKYKLRIFSNLARTGGTLVSRCIATMDNVALLSEIHPYGAQVHANFNILTQAVGWYQLFSPEKFKGKSFNFADAVELIAQACEERGLQLVIRDWVHLDFMAVPFLKTPCYHSRLVEALDDHFMLNQFHLVRHPVSQWLSTDRLAIIHGKLSINKYLEGYYRYARLCVDNGYLRYEDFCREPELKMQEICDRLDLVYDEAFKDRWHLYRNITGDNAGQGRLPKTSTIMPAGIPAIEPALYDQFAACDYYRKSLDLLGYKDVEVK